MAGFALSTEATDARGRGYRCWPEAPGPSWGVLDTMPCTVRLLKTPKSEAHFHDFAAYEQLLDAAKALDPMTHLAVLLGGDAGLRCGELMAVEWRDVDLADRRLWVARSEWKGQVTATKGGRIRYVPLTARLADTLRRHRHLRSARVLCDAAGEAWTQKMVPGAVARAARRAHVREGVHVLRHVLLTSRDARRASTGDSGVGGSQGPGDDAAVHAPASGSARRGDQVVGFRTDLQRWQQSGSDGNWGLKKLTVSALWLASRSALTD